MACIVGKERSALHPDDFIAIAHSSSGRGLGGNRHMFDTESTTDVIS